jgi:hypothetical protein
MYETYKQKCAECDSMRNAIKIALVTEGQSQLAVLEKLKNEFQEVFNSDIVAVSFAAKKSKNGNDTGSELKFKRKVVEITEDHIGKCLNAISSNPENPAEGAKAALPLEKKTVDKIIRAYETANANTEEMKKILSVAA